MADDLWSFIQELNFRWLQPNQQTPKGFGRLNHWLKQMGIHFDRWNTKFKSSENVNTKALRHTLDIPRMASYPIGLIINYAVGQMPPDQAYLNVGVWQGFSLIAGMAGHPNKTCIGIDNFSMWGGPRDAFYQRFKQWQGPAHYFYEMNYDFYLDQYHASPLGFYFYDGNHDYEHQLRGLKWAEPYFANGCIVMVDDINWEAPYKATYDFINKSDNSYEVIVDQPTTSGNRDTSQSAMHPTFWNGLLVIRKTN